MKEKICSAEQAATIATEMQAGGRKLVFTNGCFDLLHVGHIRYLQAARKLGDALLVAINGDESVRALKGEGRPLNRESDRAEVVGALECVDHVVVFPELRATAALEKIRPSIYVKGGDYQLDSLHAEERTILEKIGAEIRILPFEPGYSTSTLCEKIKENAL
jgi:rfaE bifunctional protein nucleotidyltransferase chain/domain